MGRVPEPKTGNGAAVIPVSVNAPIPVTNENRLSRRLVYADAMNSVLRHLRGSAIELIVFAAVWCAAIIAMASGDQNGIGYFQAPQHDLVWPLVAGGLINFAIFTGLVFIALPYWQSQLRPVRLILIIAASAVAGNILLQTAVQSLIIALKEPGLAGISPLALAGENLHFGVAILVGAILYRSVRDWFVGQRPPLQEKAAPDRIVLGSQANPVRLDPADIICMSSNGNYTEVRLRNARRVVHGSLTRALKVLPPETFVRIHRSHIVNLDHVERLGRTSARVGEAELPVGARFADAAMAAWKARTGRPSATH